MRKNLIACLGALALFILPCKVSDSQCPRGIHSIPYRSRGTSQIAVQVRINGHGPFQFMLDTGAQITVLDTELARELELRSEGAIGIVSVVQYARTDLARVDSLALGTHRIRNVPVAVQSLSSLRSVNREIRGILGLDFLKQFDLLIDNAHKSICLDDSRRMQYAILGERVAVVRHKSTTGNSLDVPPVLIPVHLAHDGHEDTILRIDSGSSAALLFSSRAEILPWLQKAHASRGSVSGARNPLLLAAIPEQTVRFTGHLERRISFLTPISDGSPMKQSLEDGLLPTALFKEILISFRDGFVVFNPRDACPRMEVN